jgi:starch synthase
MPVPRTLPRLNCAIHYHPDGYKADRAQVMGRHAAGAGFLKGFINYSGVDRLVAMTKSQEHYEDFRQLIGALDREKRQTVWAGPLDARTLRAVGTVFIPGPNFEAEAWNRRLSSERDFSLCGITHTVASGRIMNALGRYLIAPTQPWDALICTSTSVRLVVERMIDQHADYLERRSGFRLRSPVRLPVIPLGVDCDFHAPNHASAGLRAGLRDRLGIKENDVAALFLGRLSFHAKAHPVPMLMAAEQAAAGNPGQVLHLLIVGQFPNKLIEREFKEAATRFCQQSKVHFLDGADNALVGAAWRASDIFISLSDNIQESFGLTPIEAMAAGLPCVVSDYNGYKDTIVEGETGFRISTSAPEPGAGIDIADRYAAGLDSYDRFVGVAALATMTDIGACTEVLSRLIRDPDLRARQSAAAMVRARQFYDWRVVVQSYQTLWAELAEIRANAECLGMRDHTNETAHVDFPDPFDMFRDHPTNLIGANTVVWAKSSTLKTDLVMVREGQLNTFAASAFLSQKAIDEIVEQLMSGPARVSDFTAFLSERRKFQRTLLWLGKFDLVGFR